VLRKRWRTWLGLVACAAILTSIGFALDSTMQPPPRFTLRGDLVEKFEPGALSPDGQILASGRIVQK
jgi:hypothetical protein